MHQLKRKLERVQEDDEMMDLRSGKEYWDEALEELGYERNLLWNGGYPYRDPESDWHPSIEDTFEHRCDELSLLIDKLSEVTR